MSTVWILIFIGYSGVGGVPSAALSQHKSQEQCNVAANTMAASYADLFYQEAKDNPRAKSAYRRTLVCVEGVAK